MMAHTLKELIDMVINDAVKYFELSKVLAQYDEVSSRHILNLAIDEMRNFEILASSFVSINVNIEKPYINDKTISEVIEDSFYKEDYKNAEFGELASKYDNNDPQKYILERMSNDAVLHKCILKFVSNRLSFFGFPHIIRDTC